MSAVQEELIETPSGLSPVQTMLEPPVRLERFTFTGSGSEYFRIWIVNLLLTIVTFGIYSAWAKVRRTRYFYDSTRVAGSSFEYHGNPVAILKGRLVAVAFVGAYNIAFMISESIGFAMLGVLMLVMPWLLWKSIQFKLYNSSYRGIRFGFRGTLGKVYFVFFLLPIFALFTLYLLAPFAHQRMKKFQHEESRFGATHFSFHANVGTFYKTYLIGFLIFVAGATAITLSFGGALMGLIATGSGKGADPATIAAIVFFVFAMYLWLFLCFPIFLTMIQNLIWNNTRLSGHQFKSEMKWTRMTFIAVTNIVGIMLTLGLFIPFAQVRAMKYRIESMSLLPNDSLDNFIADTQAKASATGEGMADLLDFDLSL
ncbi:MAG: hypothetical protein A3I66_09205 [Burkholderiales bacterium RIFCSPLOWO2_02_FULL_57_36]|nr:MAG: hypothetical protein A3I66_09205 [Burkholderiales bacterium RIFCSPLOWO2_02_FULL_57_36]